MRMPPAVAKGTAVATLPSTADPIPEQAPIMVTPEKPAMEPVNDESTPESFETEDTQVSEATPPTGFREEKPLSETTLPSEAKQLAESHPSVEQSTTSVENVIQSSTTQTPPALARESEPILVPSTEASKAPEIPEKDVQEQPAATGEVLVAPSSPVRIVSQSLGAGEIATSVSADSETPSNQEETLTDGGIIASESEITDSSLATPGSPVRVATQSIGAGEIEPTTDVEDEELVEDDEEEIEEEIIEEVESEEEEEYEEISEDEEVEEIEEGDDDFAIMREDSARFTTIVEEEHSEGLEGSDIKEHDSVPREISTDQPDDVENTMKDESHSADGAVMLAETAAASAVANAQGSDQEPSAREPSVREPSVHEPSVHEPSARDPSLHDTENAPFEATSLPDPLEREQSVNELPVQEQSSSERVVPEQVAPELMAQDPSEYDHSFQDSTFFEETVLEETVFDGSMNESTLRDMSVYDTSYNEESFVEELSAYDRAAYESLNEEVVEREPSVEHSTHDPSSNNDSVFEISEHDEPGASDQLASDIPERSSPGGTIAERAAQDTNYDPVDVEEMIKQNQQSDVEGGMTTLRYDQDDDIEMGSPEAYMDDDKLENKGIEENDRKKPFGYILGIIICVMLVALVIILSVILTGNKGDDKNRDLPTPAPKPTVPPGIPTAAPTASIGWKLQGAALVGDAGSDFGGAVALGDSFMAVGAPLGGSGGIVEPYIYADGTLLQADALNGSANSHFGAALDINGNYLIIGAPELLAEGTQTPAGGAFVYSVDVSSATAELVVTLRSPESPTEASGEFGAAVAISAPAGRAVVGAPASIKNDTSYPSVGRVYTFEYGSDWVPMETEPLYGEDDGSQFGAVVDLSIDGTRFIAGAPGYNGGNGAVYVYEWTGATWDLRFALAGEDTEALGSSVAFLSENGDVFAFGSPGSKGGSGQVSVYRYNNTSNFYVEVGQPIVGDAYNLVGVSGSIAGGTSDSGLYILVATAYGVVQRYRLDEMSNTWEPDYKPVQTSLTAGISSIAAAAGINSFVAGSSRNDSAVVYELFSGPTSPLPPSTPAPGPVPSPSSTSPVSSPVVSPSPVGTFTTAPVATTTAPSVIPATPEPVAPTTAPDSNPNTSWSLVAGPFTINSVSNTGLGSSISMDGNNLVAGGPTTLNVGGVFTYETQNGSWTASTQLFNKVGGNFGLAVAVSGSLMVAGAPFVQASGTTTAVGAAYAYRLGSSGWAAEGSSIQSDAGVWAANELFGAAVACSDTAGLLVIGAPGSSVDQVNGRGRVYSFSYAGGWVQKQDILGGTSSERFGSALAISSDGTTLVVGSPGGNSFSIYNRVSGNWTLVQKEATFQSGDGMGTSVAVLSSDGQYIAVGGPNAEGGKGQIVVYSAGSGGQYVELGSAIVGEDGDTLGAQSKVTGYATSTGPVIIAATESGVVKKFEYTASSSSWSATATVDTGLSSLTAIDSAGDDTFAAGGNDQVSLYAIT